METSVGFDHTTLYMVKKKKKRYRILQSSFPFFQECVAKIVAFGALPPPCPAKEAVTAL